MQISSAGVEGGIIEAADRPKITMTSPRKPPNDDDVKTTIVDVDPATLLWVLVALLLIPLLATGLFAH